MNKVAKGKSSGDFFKTPRVMTRALLACLYNEMIRRREFTISDPFAGDGDILEEIKNYTMDRGDMIEITGSDIREKKIPGITPGMDFRNRKYGENEIVITNPPYSILDEIWNFYVESQVVRWFALLLPSDYMTTRKRSREWWNYLTHRVELLPRFDLTNWRGGEVVEYGNCSFTWFLFSTRPSRRELKYYYYNLDAVITGKGKRKNENSGSKKEISRIEISESH